MKTFIKTIGLTFLLIGFGATVQAQQRGQMMNRPQGQRMWQQGPQGQGFQRGPLAVLNIPGLTDEQKEQIQSLHLANQEATLPLRNELREKAARMRTLTTASDYDDSAVNALIDDMAELRAEIAKNRAHTHQQVRMLLTDEQRVVFDTRFGQRRGFKGGARGQGPGRNW